MSTTLRKFQIFRNDGAPLMVAPDVIKTNIQNSLGTEGGINIKDGEFIDVRYYQGHYEMNGNQKTWKVYTNNDGTISYLDPTVDVNVTTIQSYGVITGLLGIGVSKNNGNIVTNGTANTIQWIENGEEIAVNSGSEQTDAIKIGVTENPDGNFTITGTLSFTNIASHIEGMSTIQSRLKFVSADLTGGDSGKVRYTLKGTDNPASGETATWVDLASFDIMKESFVESGKVVYSLKSDATEVSGWAASWDSNYKVLNNTRLLWYSGNSHLATEAEFVNYGETNNRGEWLLKLTIKSNGVTADTTEDIYIPLPDLTYLVSGNVNLTTDKLNLVHDNGTTVEINIAGLHNINVINGDHFGSETTDTSAGSGDFIRVKAATTTDSSTGEKSTTLTSETKNSTVSAGSNDTLSATDGLLTNAAVATIENYIDNYDCGTFSITISNS